MTNDRNRLNLRNYSPILQMASSAQPGMNVVQGILLGTILGERLGKNVDERLGEKAENEASSGVSSRPLWQRLRAQIESLVTQDEPEFRTQWQEPFLPRSPGDLLLHTLPLLLYFPGAWSVQRGILEAVLPEQPSKAQFIELSQGIGALLTTPPQILSSFHPSFHPKGTIPYPKSLEQAQIWFHDNLSLRRAIDILQSDPGWTELETIASLALLCILKAQDNFSLSLGMGKQTGNKSCWICPLVGALAGAKNGLAGIPLPHQLQLPPDYRTEILTGATRLFRSTVGCHVLESRNRESGQGPIVLWKGE